MSNNTAKVSLGMASGGGGALCRGKDLRAKGSILMSSVGVPLGTASIAVSLTNGLGHSVDGMRVAHHDFLRISTSSCAFTSKDRLRVRVTRAFGMSCKRLRGNIVTALRGRGSRCTLD